MPETALPLATSEVDISLKERVRRTDFVNLLVHMEEISRSKASDVITLLTTNFQLCLYKGAEINIPNIGTFRAVYQPPTTSRRATVNVEYIQSDTLRKYLEDNIDRFQEAEDVN